MRGGGGLTPGVEVKWSDFSRLTYNLMRDFWIFDYANKYANTHPTIPPAWEFEVTDEIYEDFKKSINPEKFKYDKICEEPCEETA